MFESCMNKKSILRRIGLIAGGALFIGLIGFSYSNVVAESVNTQPTFQVQINSITPNPAKVSEDITVTGQINPQPFGNNIQKKQIVLVLDTSGSMANNSKIDNMKIAAKNFIEKVKSVSNMEVSIIEFSSKAVINPGRSTSEINAYSESTYYSNRAYYHYGGQIPYYPPQVENFYALSNTNNVNIVEGFISNLKAEGGTNTGEGLRKASYMLSQKGDPQASKSIVFMSDGLPTFYSIEGSNTSKFYTTIDGTDPKFAGTGQEQDSNVSTSAQYATTIGNVIKGLAPKINVFSIGYDLGNESSTGNKTMKAIHTSMGGDINDGTFFAADANAIDGVFSKIADKIIDNYTLSDMQINFESAVNFNSNFSLNLGGKTIDIRNINYKRDLNETSRVVYKADPIPFTFTMKANTSGDYSNVFEGAKITVPWNGKTIDTAFQPAKINVVDNLIPVINADIVSQNPDPASRSQDITLNTKIKPEAFSLNSTIFDKSGPKDIILLIDTSKSMSEEMTSLKNGLFGKIVNDSNIQNAKYGIVTFNSNIQYNYVSGLSNNTAELDSAIKNIYCSSSDDVRNLGNAMDKARDIFANSGRTNSTKYVIIITSGDLKYTSDQLFNMESSNVKAITVNLGDITQPYLQDNKVMPGATEPNNNIKNLHYNLIGKQDNGDNVLQKATKGYYINVNYSLINNINNPDEFFSKIENANQMDNPNEIHNWILPLVAKQLEGATAQINTPYYTFNPKLRFNLEGKFDGVSGLNSSSDLKYNVETPEFNVKYTLKNGQYVPDSVDNVSFTIKIKPEIDISTGVKFGPGVISYVSVGNKAIDNVVPAYFINLRSSIKLGDHGVYEGIINQAPKILDGKDQVFTFSKDSNVNFGATLKGSLNNNTGVKLELANELTLTSNPIRVYTYDDLGNLTQAGTMEKSSSDNELTTYVYKGADIVEQNILILYSQKMPSNPTKSQYTNKLITPDGEKDVHISINGELPELF